VLAAGCAVLVNAPVRLRSVTFDTPMTVEEDGDLRLGEIGHRDVWRIKRPICAALIGQHLLAAQTRGARELWGGMCRSELQGQVPPKGRRWLRVAA
jgi:hypothetical protein